MVQQRPAISSRGCLGLHDVFDFALGLAFQGSSIGRRNEAKLGVLALDEVVIDKRVLDVAYRPKYATEVSTAIRLLLFGLWCLGS